ncbi:peroxidasin-like [Hypomesus transpacificus]|uniref:peroxidasin-like n=1 Tax=Hypomesus transpacificus TaxID=137520 RepID=UPI001F071AC6|nr:peroxidasin-like [Hypomesus transpacificus]
MKTVFLFCAFLSALGLVPLEGIILFVKQGASAQINCGVKIKNQNVEWTYGDQKSLIVRINGRSGKQTKGNIPNIQVKRSGEHLEIPSVGGGDVGLYTCKVDSAEHKHRLYIVTASVTPSSDVLLGTAASLHCQVTGEPKPKVEWLRPGGGLTESSGQVQLSDVTLKDAGDWTCRISKDGETHQEIVNVRVQSSKPTVPPSGPKDVSVTRCSNCSTVLQPGETEGGEVVVHGHGGLSLWGLSLWVWIAVGAGGLVLILLVVLVVLMQRRNRRMKRRGHKLRTVRQPLKPNEYCHCTNRAVGPPPKGRPREKPSPVAKQQHSTGRSNVGSGR